MALSLMTQNPGFPSKVAGNPLGVFLKGGGETLLPGIFETPSPSLKKNIDEIGHYLSYKS